MKSSIVLSILFSTYVLLVGVDLMAQVNPSSELLLRSTNSSEQDYSSSSRYTVKPKEEKSVQVKKKVTDLPGSPDQRPRQLLSEPTPEKQEEKTIFEPEVEPPEIQYQLKEAFWAGGSPRINLYKQQLHSRDSRLNILELEVAPGYYYMDSNSSYWFRSHFSSGPSLSTSLSVWLTPFFGLKTTYETTVGANIQAQPGSSDSIEVDHEWFTLGLRFRSYFGMTRKAKSLHFGVDFNESKATVPENSTHRISTETKGLRLSLETSLPDSLTHSWQFGVEYLPGQSHVETATQLNLSSGIDNNANAIGIWFGSRVNYDRKNQFFWRVSHRVEKDVFSGVANTNDLITGSSPSGVTVTNTTTKLNLGFTWGR